jgi:hypothetical protein
MSSVRYHTILKYRLIVSLFSVDEVCFVCRKACLYNFGEYAVHCRELSDFKCRHDFICARLFNILNQGSIPVKFRS